MLNKWQLTSFRQTNWNIWFRTVTHTHTVFEPPTRQNWGILSGAPCATVIESWDTRCFGQLNIITINVNPVKSNEFRWNGRHLDPSISFTKLIYNLAFASSWPLKTSHISLIILWLNFVLRFIWTCRDFWWYLAIWKSCGSELESNLTKMTFKRLIFFWLFIIHYV